MADQTDRKLYLGPRLRLLRRELGINQTQMAEELGVSPSYLNHLERNQRPLTAQMLLRLANTYDIDIRDFMSGGGHTAVQSLGEVFADDLLRDIGIPRQEILEVAENYPGVAEAVSRLYRALSDLRRVPDMLESIGGRPGVTSSPLEWLRSFIQQHGNHFPDLDAAAEEIAGTGASDAARFEIDLRQRLADRHGIAIQVLPEAKLLRSVWHHDFHRRRLLISERLPAPGRLFAIARQICAIELSRLLQQLADRAAPPDDETRRVLGVALTNYAAAALTMPYGRFHQAAEDSRYDLALLQARFGASFEQVAHRLTTLNRSGARGVPFFMLKVDIAGTISKRFAGEAFPFAQFGGACPRWDIHACFRRRGETIVQVVETPDERRYLTLSRSLPGGDRPDARSQWAIGLGCELKHAARIGYADGQSVDRIAPVAVGPACHICEREGCPDRALPPVTRSLAFPQHARAATPYPFSRG